MLNPHKVNQKIIKYILIAVILVSLAIFISMTDFDEVLLQIEKLGNGFLWVLLASFFAYLSGCLSWKYCFNDSSKVTMHRLFYIRTVGELITLFNPTNIVAGEASKFYLLKDVPLTKEEKLDSILLSRVVLILSQVVLAIACCFWMSFYYERNVFWVCGIVILCLLVIVFMALSNMRNVLKLFGRSRFKIIRTCYIQLRNIQERLRVFVIKQKTKVAISYVWATIHWLCGASEIYIILYFLGLDLLMMHSIIVDTGVVVLKSVAGFIPGQIGIEELSNKWLLSLIGIQGAGIWLTVSLLRRFKQLFWICLSALFYVADQYLINQKKSTKWQYYL